MKKYTINTAKKYTKDGVEKTQWNNVGRLVEFKEGEFALELNMFPDTKYFVFEDKPKGSVENPTDATPKGTAEDDIEIPF